jgi:hypothetical protein
MRLPERDINAEFKRDEELDRKAEAYVKEATARASRTYTVTTHDEEPEADAVNSPPHYTSHPSGVECIDVAEHFGFNLGNAIKYVWRADLKRDAIEDLKKAAWYLNREIERRER